MAAEFQCPRSDLGLVRTKVEPLGAVANGVPVRVVTAELPSSSR